MSKYDAEMVKIVDNEFKSLALKMINDFKLFSIEQTNTGSSGLRWEIQQLAYKIQ